MGKTRLLEYARSAAAAAGLRVLSARGSPLERSFAFGVVRQLFEAVLARGGAAEREEILEGPAALALPVFRGRPEEPAANRARMAVCRCCTASTGSPPTSPSGSRS